MSQKRPKATSPERSANATISVLPMEVRVGDRLTDEQAELEVDTHPAALHGAKSFRVGLRKVGEPIVVRYVTWPAHEKVTIRRRP